MPEETPVGEESPVTAEFSEAVGATTTMNRRRRRSRQRAFVEWLIILVVAVGASFFMRSYVVQTFFIPSGSMEPTLQIGDRIIVSKLSLDIGSIHRGDILVFKSSPAISTACNDSVQFLVKRVIGLPGDHLTSRGNTIYVNGMSLDETWTHTEPLGSPIGNVTVPAGRYFMMGDNHSNSCDSRSWGTIPRSAIVGRAFFRIWPLSHSGLL